jgi:Alkylmercury lyase
MSLDIKTAAELIALDVEGRGRDRRAARETEVLQHVYRAFVDRPGPIAVEEIVASFPDRALSTVRESLATLDAEDLLQLHAGRVELAYPFSAAPTAFVVDLGDGRGERFACCAIDALGLAPMLGRRIHIRSQCHHCAAPLALAVSPTGPGPEAAGIMVWVGKRAEDRRACDSL